MASNIVKAIPLITFNTAGLLANYQLINGPDGLPSECFFLGIINDSGADITLSFDGIIDHEYLPAGYNTYMPAQMNSQPNAQVALFPKRLKIYVKSAAAAAGTLAISGYYV
jgi:hypothetical protein